MSAYFVLDVEVIDPVSYQGYLNMATPTVSLYGGKYIVRGGKSEILEGDWSPKRLVIIEFESTEKVLAWLNSPEYAPAHELRLKYARSKSIVVEGVV
jgi:uncharacterized protein (DUF1330 family)